jgi:hypothetical protein
MVILATSTIGVKAAERLILEDGQMELLFDEFGHIQIDPILSQAMWKFLYRIA